MSRYTPIYTTLYSGVDAKFAPFVLNKAAPVNVVPVYDFIQLSNMGFGGGIVETFAQEDRPMIRRVSLFANFADGMPIPRFAIPFNFRDFVSIRIKADTVGGPLAYANLPIPTFNTWFEVNTQVPVPGVSDFQIWGGIQTFSFFSASIDAAYDGQGITFTLGVEVEHTFPLVS